MEGQQLRIELPPVSVIIPAYNEQKRIATMVSSILTSGFPCELIVVDDGSTDETGQVLLDFGKDIRLIKHSTNRGKGAAVASAIKQATGEIVILMDAHLLGLTHFHLLSLVLPLVEDATQITVGIDTPEKPRLRGILSPFWIVSGQRAYWRKDLLPLLSDFEELGYGLEVFLFSRFRDARTMIVSLSGVVHPMKWDKIGLAGTAISYIREVIDIVGAVKRLRGRKWSGPIARKRNEHKSGECCNLE